MGRRQRSKKRTVRAPNRTPWWGLAVLALMAIITIALLVIALNGAASPLDV